MTETTTDAPAEPMPLSGRSRRRKLDKKLVLAAVVVGLGLALVVRGLLVSVTGDARSHLPDAVERIDPVAEATQVLSQTNVFVDLASGYTGTLTIDGVELETVELAPASPGQQVVMPPAVVYEPGNATLTFTPSDDAPITEFTEGLHRVVLHYWLVDETSASARTYTWTFNVV